MNLFIDRSLKDSDPEPTELRPNMPNATNQFLCDCLLDRTCRVKRCSKGKPKLTSHIFSTILLFSVVLYIICIPPVEATGERK